MQVLSLVSASIDPDRRAAVADAYRRGIEAGLPPGLARTYLLAADDGTIAVASLWESREALETMRGSGEEPFARRLLREAGGEPDATFFDVLVAGGEG